MIILRQRHFSISDRKMIEKVINKLESEDIEDFKVVSSPRSDVISIGISQGGIVKIYLPLAYEYTQFDIDDYIRRNLGTYFRTSTTRERNLYVQSIRGEMSVSQIYSLIEYIIEETEFCAIIE